MAQLLTQLNKTQGNYQDVFIYTINTSFNGIQDTIANAQIKILFPDFLTIYPGDIQSPIQNMTAENVDGGILYTFDMGAISDLGITLRFGIGVMFSPVATNETEVAISPELWINGELYIASTSEPIQLLVNPDFRLTHQLILPDVLPSAGGVAYYQVLLKNYGDLGGAIENVQITCNSPEGFEIDSSYSIIGRDVSPNGFEDISQDDLLGIVSDNRITFSIESFYGEAYAFIYRVILADDMVMDSEYTSAITWSANSISQGEVPGIFSVSNPIYKTNFSLYTPDYSLPGRLINYEASVSNAGNQDLNSVVLTIEIPPGVILDSFTSGRYYLGIIQENIGLSYDISYTTNAGISGTIGTYNTDNNSSISTNDFLNPSDSILSLSWEFPTLPVGFTTRSVPQFNGRVRESTPLNSMALCKLDIAYYANNIPSSNQTNGITLIQDICVLTPTFSSSIGSNPIRPGEIFQYTIGANCRRSRLNTPIFDFYLPKELAYAGNISGDFYDYFRTQGALKIPDPSITANVNANEDTLLTFSFTDDYAADFEQKSRIKITFDVQVLPASKGEFSSFFLLDAAAPENNLSVKSNVYTNAILFFLSISSKKEVMGFLDEDYAPTSAMGTTLSGEEVMYRITLRNTGNADLNSIEIIDILPHIGDKGIIEEGISRGSEFPTILTTEVTAFINSTDIDSTSVPKQDVDFNIAYSLSSDPLRFGNQFNIIGDVDDWSTTPPNLLSDARSIKLSTNDTILLPGEALTILLKTTIPYGTPVGAIAWNSFAADVSYTDFEGNEQHLLAIEPDKVGVQVISPDETKGRISGFVFWDEYKNGEYVYSTQRTLLTNDIGVVLYDSKGIPLRVTFTNTNTNGTHGQYAFSNLEIGAYYLRFFTDTDIQDFSTIGKLTLTGNFNTANAQGITPLIDLTQNQYMDNVLAGIRSNTDRKINEILGVNRSSKQMLRNVIYDQMLIGMKQEDVIELIEKQ
ncbi:MAG: hypothetical protein R3Y40_06510 [Eubacteriales bacterium]